MKTVIYFIYGILMSIANVIPGVSGGTVALILNFYDQLMESITLNLKVIKKNLHFIIPLGLGVVVGTLAFAKVMKFLLNQFPTQTFSAFAGIVCGSLPLIYFIAKKKKEITKTNWIVFLLALSIMIGLAFVQVDKGNALIRYESFSVEAGVMCFIAMAIATATMIIPGISGSLMLLIMGMYGTIYVSAIGNFNIPLLIPSVLGALLGLLGGAKLIHYLLNKHEQLTYMAILGLLLGSLIELVKQSGIFNVSLPVILASLCCFLVMFSVVYLFSQKEIKKMGV